MASILTADITITSKVLIDNTKKKYFGRTYNNNISEHMEAKMRSPVEINGLGNTQCHVALNSTTKHCTVSHCST